MIIPSIDLMNAHAVQLVGGDEEKKQIDAGDPRPIARDFGVTSEIAVIDLDAAMGKGDNTSTIRDLLRVAPCRVGGGIRTLDRALEWLDAGASKIIIGTAAKRELLEQLPHDRVLVALDARDGEIQVEGWKKGTGARVVDRMRELREHCSGFLVTFIEKEGRMDGTQMGQVEELVKESGPASLTIAGGVTTSEEIAELDRMGVDAQVGMALYSGRLSYADAVMAPMRSDRPDGLWPTVVVDERGVALGLVYSNPESVTEAIKSRRGVYWSRSRGGLWKKGDLSGNVQELIRLDLDCDRDALRFTVRQTGEGFCHLRQRTCWGEDHALGALDRLLHDRLTHAPEGSYSRRLFDDAELLAKKIVEEAQELVDAETPNDVRWEAADLIYFSLVRALGAGVRLENIERELHERSLKVRRRGGDAKG